MKLDKLLLGAQIVCGRTGVTPRRHVMLVELSDNMACDLALFQLQVGRLFSMSRTALYQRCVLYCYASLCAVCYLRSQIESHPY